MFRPAAALRLSLLAAIVAVAACSEGAEPTAASASVAGGAPTTAKKPTPVEVPTVRAFGSVTPISAGGLFNPLAFHGVTAVERHGVGRYCVMLAAPVQYAVVVATV